MKRIQSKNWYLSIFVNFLLLGAIISIIHVVAYDGAPELSTEEKIVIANHNPPVDPSNEILSQSHGDEGTHRRILQFGVRRTRIWIIAIVLLIIIVGAIGAGFGAMSRIKSEKR